MVVTGPVYGRLISSNFVTLTSGCFGLDSCIYLWYSLMVLIRMAC